MDMKIGEYRVIYNTKTTTNCSWTLQNYSAWDPLLLRMKRLTTKISRKCSLLFYIFWTNFVKKFPSKKFFVLALWSLYGTFLLFEIHCHYLRIDKSTSTTVLKVFSSSYVFHNARTYCSCYVPVTSHQFRSRITSQHSIPVQK